MVRSILKWTGIVLLALIVSAVAAFVYFRNDFIKSDLKKHVYAVTVADIAVDSSLVELGGRLAVIRGCRDCHGDNLAGKTFIDAPELGTIYTPNLTSGAGSAISSYTDEDWVRAIRHGVRPDSTALMIMPAYEYIGLSDHDLAAIVAYIKQVPPVDHVMPASEIGPLTYVLNGAGALKVFVAEHMDHTIQPTSHMVPEVSLEFGRYLSVTCTGCHQADFHGGKAPAPGFMVPPSIAGSSRVGTWTEEEFIATLRTGVRPDGTAMSIANMPWNITQNMTDVELKALFMYLQSRE